MSACKDINRGTKTEPWGTPYMMWFYYKKTHTAYHLSNKCTTENWAYAHFNATTGIYQSKCEATIKSHARQVKCASQRECTCSVVKSTEWENCFISHSHASICSHRCTTPSYSKTAMQGHSYRRVQGWSHLLGELFQAVIQYYFIWFYKRHCHVLLFYTVNTGAKPLDRQYLNDTIISYMKHDAPVSCRPA